MSTDIDQEPYKPYLHLPYAGIEFGRTWDWFPWDFRRTKNGFNVEIHLGLVHINFGFRG